MALAMPSRFAVLKIEDDDFRPSNPNKSKEKKKSDVKQTSKKGEKSGTTAKKAPKQVVTNKPQSQQKKEKKKKEAAAQWEQWKQKDSEYVDGNFEQDLHTAILQSKLDFEAKKTLYKQHKKEIEQVKKGPEIPNGKKKKNKTMSLEQFKNMVSTTQDPSAGKVDNQSSKSSETENDIQFFDRVKSETKVELNKELHKDQNKEVRKVRKSFNNDTITIAQLQEKIEALQSQNSSIKAELEKAKEETLVVKKRNKTLCGMLAVGEMKDKADVLMELEKLVKVREELTEEVSRLHGLLEQERSKVGALTTEVQSNNRHKDKNKKRTGNENTQQ